MTSYAHLVQQVQLLGNPHTARGLITRELVGARLMHPAGHLANRRGLNRALGYLELCQLIAGVFDVGAIARVAPRANLGLFTEQAAYGPRVYGCADQLAAAIEELAMDPGSRRATIYMSDPGEDFPMRPCTNSLQFLVRDGLVHCVVSMRSWDLYLGAPYDLTMFGGLTMLVARVLGYQPGQVTVVAGSAHIYQEHLGYNDNWAKPPAVRFLLPEYTSLYMFRRWARQAVDDPGWTSGAPAGIHEVQL